MMVWIFSPGPEDSGKWNLCAKNRTVSVHHKPKILTAKYTDISGSVPKTF